MKTISEIRKNNIKKDFIVENLMKSNGIYCLVAKPKAGKSLLALQLAGAVATGQSFLGYRSNPSPVLYISTEMDSNQLLERINTMNLEFNDKNFFLIEQNPNERKLNLMNLQYQFKEFSEEYNGKLVIVDMFSGIDLNNSYDLNNYQDVGQYVIPKFREMCKKFNFTMLLIHHLNKSNTPLGSTAIEGSVDGIITLKKDNDINTKVFLNYESRDYEGLDIVLKRNDNLIYELSNIDSTDLNYNIIQFLNYAIKQKEFTFTSSDITSKLNLQITPVSFGRLLANNIENLKKEGLYIEQKRSGIERTYYAKYKEPEY